MRMQLTLPAVIAAAGLAAPAAAQDSVSAAGGLPGDALSPFTDHAADYIVDLTPFTTSHGHVFGVAPIIKSTKVSSDFFNNLTSSAAISPNLLENFDTISNSYALWENEPGAGVNPNANLDPSFVQGSFDSSQFSVAQLEFGTGSSGFLYEGLIGAFVNYELGNPNRLFVTRRQMAISETSPAVAPNANFGGVSIDARGNMFYRADGFFFPPDDTGSNPYSGSNILRTRISDRSTVAPNAPSEGGGNLDATDLIIFESATSHNVSNMIPAEIAGGNGLYAGLNFNTEYVYGDVGSVSSTTGHLDTTGGIGGDHRGSNGYSGFDLLGVGAAATFGAISEDAGGTRRVLNLWGVDSGGNVVGSPRGFEAPKVVTDNWDSFSIDYSVSNTESFENYRSQTAFDGGVAQVALTRDQNGDTLVAGLMHENGVSDDFSNQMLVARVDDTGAVSWTVAAYIDQFSVGLNGKAITDGSGNTIGQLTSLLNVTGGAPLGPSMSLPAFDSVGNLWFIAAVELMLDGGGIDFDSALIRGIYDPATFSYQLELVMELGQVFTGQNSGVDYQITFLGIADDDSHRSGTIFSNAARETAWNNTPVAGLDPADPITNGGVVLQAEIVYDVDDDGVFDDTLGTDESYQTLLYVGYYQQEANPCPTDLNDDDTLDFFDVSAFLADFNSACTPGIGDYNSSGGCDFFDVSAFLADFNAGCP